MHDATNWFRDVNN